MKIHQALLSVSDKTGIVEFARELSNRGIDIISSGGTARALTKEGITCREISDVTGSPEILDGRVKTLHPAVHGGILARRDKPGHLAELARMKIRPIDIVVVNLYPFEDTLASVRRTAQGALTDDIVENIDIGGVTLLRAAAKNCAAVLVVCDPADYAAVLERISSDTVDDDFRRDCAAKAFRHTAYYDALIAEYFTRENFPSQKTVPLRLVSGLRYGENPHQQAALYRQAGTDAPSAVVRARVLQGKELSYNNYLDLDAAWRLVRELPTPSCVVVKHNNPCGSATGTDTLDAYRRARACDPVSAFGGIIAFNVPLSADTAAEVTQLFTECVIAPSVDDGARAAFALKKNLRLLECPFTGAAAEAIELRALEGGMLAQDRDALLLAGTKTVTRLEPDKTMLASLRFAWTVCKHVKSNTIVLARGSQTVGVGAGQMSRIDALHIAAAKMKEVELDPATAALPLVLASDAFFPFNDVVTQAAALGVKAVIQPGGSVRDADSITAADQLGLAMVMTGMRHFRH